MLGRPCCYYKQLSLWIWREYMIIVIAKENK
jgi:hypothetical protein